MPLIMAAFIASCACQSEDIQPAAAYFQNLRSLSSFHPKSQMYIPISEELPGMAMMTLY